MNRRFIALLAVFTAACAAKSNPAPPTTASPVCSAPAVASAAPVVLPSAPVVTGAPAPKPPERRAEKLALKRIELARGVQNHEPLEPTTSFNAKEPRVYAFVEIENPEKLPGEVTVEFAPPKGRPQGEVKLAIGEGARWRTWAFTRQAHESGEWTAIVRDSKGRELGRKTFEVEL